MKKLLCSRILLLTLLLFISLPTPAIAKKMNILVYPFENTGNKEYSWISAGMTETVINDLMGIREVSVISNEDKRKIMEETKFILSGLVAEETMLKVGKLTGANIIFTGSYLVSDNNIRVIARLINVETGKVETSAKLDGNLEKIFDLQDKVILTLLSDTSKVTIPDVTQVKIPETDKKKITEKPRPKTTAYELYAKGLELRDTSPKEALSYFKKALEVDKTYVSALIQAGFAAGYTLNLFDEALNYLTLADKISKSRRATDTTDYAGLMMNIGIVYWQKGDLDRALKYFMDSQQILDRLALQNTSGFANLMSNIGTVYNSKGDYDRALRYYLDAQAIEERLGLQNTAGYAVLMMNIGVGYWHKGDHDRALRYYLDSKEIRDRLGLQNTAGYAGLMTNIGNVYYSKGDNDRALRYYLDSKEIRDRLGLQNTADYAGLLFNIGLLYEKRGERGMAGRYYRSSYDTYVRAGYIGSDRDNALSNAQSLGY